MPELPPSNLSRVPSGTDVRDLGREINKVIEALNTVCGIVRSLSRFDRPNAPPPHFPSRTNFPFEVYISGGYVCVREGHHIWWNSYTTTAAITTLSKAEGDAWVGSGSATVIYVKRLYNSDGTATVTLEHANTDYATVAAGITTTEARWILATLSGGSITQQWHRNGDIPELRVS